MGLGVVFVLMGLFVILISQKMAKLIALDKQSKTLETGLRIFVPFFGLLFVVFGSLIAFDLLQSSISTQINYFRAYGLTCIGTLSLIGSPFLTMIMLKKFPENKHILLVGKKGFYVFFIGLGIVALTAGILELTGLF
ncbi:MAG: hypothetical protein WC479_08025 [Candidatus Izemoplasmatales bacterium]|jgi:hypothetical protein|nr:hypothetical protein [Candidatus Izemoplasmatales bacterium]MDD3865922.1 hypothetical protein [Candidatus Izemoplasmatales bacterium]